MVVIQSTVSRIKPVTQCPSACLEKSPLCPILATNKAASELIILRFLAAKQPDRLQQSSLQKPLPHPSAFHSPTSEPCHFTQSHHRRRATTIDSPSPSPSPITTRTCTVDGRHHGPANICWFTRAFTADGCRRRFADRQLLSRIKRRS